MQGVVHADWVFQSYALQRNRRWHMTQRVGPFAYVRIAALPVTHGE